MTNINEKLLPFGIKTGKFLIPKNSIDLKKWATVACDQYSSEPEYWEEVKQFVANNPSTLNMIFPECYLDLGDEEERIKNINKTMIDSVNQKILDETEEAFILICRETKSGIKRWGLMTLLDLEKYDFSEKSTSLIRATEGTIIERIPPRLKIRKNASIEIPHIMVLVDDAKAALITPLQEELENKNPLYSTELMMNSGKLTGWLVNDENLLKNFSESLKTIADPTQFKEKTGSSNPLLFAIGDGNHSLATAKTAWENIKKEQSTNEQKNHPARFALVELNSIYDKGIEFEPIHRTLFQGNAEKFINDFSKKFDISISETTKPKLESLAKSIPIQQQFGLVTKEKMILIQIKNPDSNLTAGTFQKFTDHWLKENTQTEIDYIHGVESTLKLGSTKGNFGIILPNIDKSTFFETVIRDGSFPRKTFSMGEAHEKRFYFEARKIK